MKRIECVIFVEPTAKGRPRTSVRNGHAFVYTPKKTATAEADIKAAIRKEVMEQGAFDAKVPLSVSATFYIEKPKSTSKKITMPVTRPDVDNYGKTLCDALQKFVYPDDSQITTLHIKKRYGSPPRITVCISEEGLE